MEAGSRQTDGQDGSVSREKEPALSLLLPADVFLWLLALHQPLPIPFPSPNTASLRQDRQCNETEGEGGRWGRERLSVKEREGEREAAGNGRQCYTGGE
ncbi:hypothetical protein J4Q44_G00362650 [Coregonus suidteri]|uniref:Uncharacterized protein n=1 Tax=Coregonus suidteri TaxID=861788 RepID=A0AAN8KR39_9TELE